MKERKTTYHLEYHPRSNGRSYYDIVCPFCEDVVQVQAWGAGRGKRCYGCGALIFDGLDGQFYGKKETTNKE